MSKSFDKTLKRLCNKKISEYDAPLLSDNFTVTEAIAAAVIKKAMSGTTDSVKLIREILDEGGKEVHNEFKVDINVVE